MKRNTGKSSGSGKRSRLRDKAQAIVTQSGIAIVALQSAAFASAARTSQPVEIEEDFPFLGPAELAVVGATIATIGAYRLMKARKPPGRPDGDKAP